MCVCMYLCTYVWMDGCNKMSATDICNGLLIECHAI